MGKTAQIVNNVPLNWCFACVDLSNLEIRRSYPSNSEYVSIADLENLIASWDLVESRGGLELAKEHRLVLALIEDYKELEILQHAISDVESVG